MPLAAREAQGTKWREGFRQRWQDLKMAYEAISEAKIILGLSSCQDAVGWWMKVQKFETLDTASKVRTLPREDLS